MWLTQGQSKSRMDFWLIWSTASIHYLKVGLNSGWLPGAPMMTVSTVTWSMPWRIWFKNICPNPVSPCFHTTERIVLSDISTLFLLLLNLHSESHLPTRSSMILHTHFQFYIHFSYFLLLHALFTSVCPVAPFPVPDLTKYFLG